MDSQAFDDAFEKVGKLAATFKANETRYLATDYQEAEARIDFITPFFEALGWKRSQNPYAQEFHIEHAVSAAGQRRADYAFFLAPNFRDVRFYVEAKKPHGEIATADNYFQTIRYGSGSRTPLAVLTDFEQFHVLDSRFKADIKTALQRCVRRYRYTDYTDREKFAEIYWLFSREAVAGGSLEKLAATLPKKGKGIPPPHLQNIDDAFLVTLEGYRATLARAFKNRNPRMDSDTLTEATQRTLDRLVFMRFLEDKVIETKSLVARFTDPKSAWQDFVAASRRLDHIYNGIVFKEHAILDAASFRADNEAFAEICRDLSDEYSSYNFATIPIHILGSIYERFLGKVIVATDKRVRVEEKPEVRKAGGVYYTPEYIVRYIVENTVGKLIEGKTPDQIAGMRFADIACGSGSFLLGVYDLLLTHHGRWYNDNRGKAKKGDCIERDGQLYLSLRKKREILINSIYGVDIDTQAVEVTQLSLYLKLLQDETTASAHEHQQEFHETLLPPLNKNIVCGNSLIGRDILEGQLFPNDEERKLNSMNFEDAFPHIFERKSAAKAVREGESAYGVARSLDREGGRRVYPSPPTETRGFDAIVGNPPYLYSAGQEHKAYFESHFTLSEYQTDFYVYFIERAMQKLKTGGRMGMIISDSWIKGRYFTKLREHLLRQTQLETVTVFDYPPFEGATIENSIIVLEKTQPSETLIIRKFGSPTESADLNVLHVDACLAKGFIDTHHSDANSRIIAHLEMDSHPLSSLCKLNRGVHAYRTDGYGKSKFSKGAQTKRDKDERSYHSRKKLDSTFYPEVKGKHLDRYSYTWDGTYVSYGDWLAEARTPEFFFSPKLAIRKIIAPKLVCTFIKEHTILDQSVYVAVRATPEPPHLLFLLGILTSSVGGWYIRTKHGIYDTLYPWFTKEQLAQFPIPTLDFAKEADESRHDAMVRMVEQMLEAKKQLVKAKTDKDKTYYENKCAALDRQIDRLVYELYGMTEEEIRVLERDS